MKVQDETQQDGLQTHRSFDGIQPQAQPVSNQQQEGIQTQHSSLKLISIILLCTLTSPLITVYSSFTSENILLHRYDIQQSEGFEEMLTSYRFDRVFTSAFFEPNLILLVVIVLGQLHMLSFIERSTCSPIFMYQYGSAHVFMQFIRVPIQIVMYYGGLELGGLGNVGAAAATTNLVFKLSYYNRQYRVRGSVGLAITILTGIYLKRYDILIALVSAGVQCVFMKGGVIKYPKQTFQQKQEWAQIIGLARLPLWASYIDSQYEENELMTVHSDQFYISKQERLRLVRKM